MTTMVALVVAFTLATGIGVAVSFVIGIPRVVRQSVFPLVLLAYAIPQTTVLPLFILIFGTGTVSKVAFGFSHGVFPIVIAAVGALQDIKPTMVKCARSMGASRLQLLRLVILPSIVPGLFTGMRLGMSATLLGILLAELYVTSSGIGHYTHVFTETFQPSKLFALIAVLAAMAVILNESMRRIEIQHGRWRN
jgi:ABC-type nitrate/sulfonate/bicarbonate transport system permease component